MYTVLLVRVYSTTGPWIQCYWSVYTVLLVHVFCTIGQCVHNTYMGYWFMCTVYCLLKYWSAYTVLLVRKYSSTGSCIQHYWSVYTVLLVCVYGITFVIWRHNISRLFKWRSFRRSRSPDERPARKTISFYLNFPFHSGNCRFFFIPLPIPKLKERSYIRGVEEWFTNSAFELNSEFRKDYKNISILLPIYECGIPQ